MLLLQNARIFGTDEGDEINNILIGNDGKYTKIAPKIAHEST